MYTVTITKSGQITLPKELRDFLGVELGGRVTFHKTKNGVNIERKMTDEEFSAGMAKIRQKYHSKTDRLPDAESAVRSFRDGKLSRLKKYYQEKFA